MVRVRHCLVVWLARRCVAALHKNPVSLKQANWQFLMVRMHDSIWGRNNLRNPTHVVGFGQGVCVVREEHVFGTGVEVVSEDFKSLLTISINKEKVLGH